MARLRHRRGNRPQAARSAPGTPDRRAPPPAGTRAMSTQPATRLWSAVLALLLWCLPAPHPALAAACQEAALMLVHPEVAPPYDRVIEQLAEGLAERASGPIGVCALATLSTRDWADPPRQVVAVGPSAYKTVTETFPEAQVLPILVKTLPSPARAGLSPFVEPRLVLEPLRRLSPATEILYFVHLAEVPTAFVERAQATAEALALRWVPIAVADLHDAALAIARIHAEAGRTSAVWFHRDVLALQPDILIPPIVRRSWEVGFPVISDDADSVERGLLFALAPDYHAVGRAALGLLGDEQPGLTDLRWVRPVFNTRTARAIGLTVRAGQETGFDGRDD